MTCFVVVGPENKSWAWVEEEGTNRMCLVYINYGVVLPINKPYSLFINLTFVSAAPGK